MISYKPLRRKITLSQLKSEQEENEEEKFLFLITSWNPSPFPNLLLYLTSAKRSYTERPYRPGIATALSHLPSKLRSDIQLRRNQAPGKLLYWFSSTCKPERLDTVALRCTYLSLSLWEYVFFTTYLFTYTISEGMYSSESQYCFSFRKEQEAWQVLPPHIAKFLHHLSFLRYLEALVMSFGLFF